MTAVLSDHPPEVFTTRTTPHGARRVLTLPPIIDTNEETQ